MNFNYSFKNKATNKQFVYKVYKHMYEQVFF